MVDRDQLASTYVGSPDPRQKNPPSGQELIIEWRLPPEAIKETLRLQLSLLYRDYTQETVCYPIAKRRGAITYALLNKKFKEKRGFITYKAEIVDEQGEVIKEWKQLLWTDLITIEEPTSFLQGEPDQERHEPPK